MRGTGHDGILQPSAVGHVELVRLRCGSFVRHAFLREGEEPINCPPLASTRQLAHFALSGQLAITTPPLLRLQ